jgi:prepilin-type N-terminal cleavage/methylation domain-containing protein
MANRRLAFTLSELLFCVAIIAILAGILFPVFAGAKQSARKAESIELVKQLVAADSMYRDNWDGAFPLSASTAILEPTKHYAYGYCLPTYKRGTLQKEGELSFPAEDPLYITSENLDGSDCPIVDLFYSRRFKALYNGVGVIGFVDGHAKAKVPEYGPTYDRLPDPRFEERRIGSIWVPSDDLLPTGGYGNAR